MAEQKIKQEAQGGAADGDDPFGRTGGVGRGLHRRDKAPFAGLPAVGEWPLRSRSGRRRLVAGEQAQVERQLLKLRTRRLEIGVLVQREK